MRIHGNRLHRLVADDECRRPASAFPVLQNEVFARATKPFPHSMAAAPRPGDGPLRMQMKTRPLCRASLLSTRGADPPPQAKRASGSPHKIDSATACPPKGQMASCHARNRSAAKAAPKAKAEVPDPTRYHTPSAIRRRGFPFQTNKSRCPHRFLHR